MNSMVDPQNPDRDLINQTSDEQPYDGGGWPGDGSGTDDLADFNANEADDYRDEGDDMYGTDTDYDEYQEG